MQKRYLVCPLHWGLGHATRCIPIVRNLLAEGHVVYLASDGGALALLRKEFPALPSFELPSYNIEYRYESILLNVALQSGRFYHAMRAEQKVTQTLVNQLDIDIIISDNRFGCYAKANTKKNIENIFITHQINLLTGYSWLNPLARWLNHRLIRRFDMVWIPDFELEKDSLAGELSHGYTSNLPPIRYIGPISRFVIKDLLMRYDVAVILSGPEPQRSYMEQDMIRTYSTSHQNCIIVQGIIMDEMCDEQRTPTLRVVSHLTSDALNDLICSSSLIVARSGYTTIMDLAKLQKKCLLIPTPGQTEQKYLAIRHQQNT